MCCCCSLLSDLFKTQSITSSKKTYQSSCQLMYLTWTTEVNKIRFFSTLLKKKNKNMNFVTVWLIWKLLLYYVWNSDTFHSTLSTAVVEEPPRMNPLSPPTPIRGRCGTAPVHDITPPWCASLHIQCDTSDSLLWRVSRSPWGLMQNQGLAVQND